LLLLLLFSSPAFSAEGKIFGTVANMTQNKWVSNGEVTLHTFKDSASLETKKTKSDKRGNFSFSGLEIAENISYAVSIHYQGVEYSQGVRLSSETLEQNIALNIFEKGSDDSQIKIAMHHIIVESSGGEFVDIMEFILVENSSLTSYLGQDQMPITTPHGDRVGLKLGLPKGYENLEFIDGMSQASTAIKDDMILDSHAVKPGETPMIYRYKLKASEPLDLSRKLTYATTRFMLMISDSIWQPTSSAFQKGEDANFHGKTYATYTYSLSDPSKSGSIDIKLIRASSKSKSSAQANDISGSSRSNPDWLMPTVIAIVAAGAGASFSLAFTSKRRKEAKPTGKSEKPEKPEKVDISMRSWATLLSHSELEKLKEIHLEFISRLDELRESNKIPENVYEGVRAEEKKKLAAVIAKLEQFDK
jgi:hypothetical protein